MLCCFKYKFLSWYVILCKHREIGAFLPPVISYQPVPRTIWVANVWGSSPSQFMLKCQMCWNMIQPTSIVYDSRLAKGKHESRLVGCCCIASLMGQNIPLCLQQELLTFPVADLLKGSWHRPTSAGRGPTGWRMNPPTW